MRFEDIYTYKNAEEAKQYIGKKGAFSNSLRDISDLPEGCDVLILREVGEGFSYPFAGEHKGIFQFFRPVLEERRMRMTWAEILEWLARGNGFVYIPSDYYDEPHFDIYIHIDDVTDETLDMEVGEDIRIRHFGTDEIIVPTNAIYEEDCR